MTTHPNFKDRAGRSVLASAITAILVGGTGTAAHAQDDGASRTLEEITVTGSRIRQDDFTSATPTTVIDNDYLNSLGIVNLGNAMVQMPQNVNTNSPTGGDPASGAGPGGNFFNGSSIANLRGLNPFFGSRTLTLVDSRRHVPTNQGDGVDLNFIPTVIIDRMETVTGGASASYGSGAISGVQNILLDRDFTGVRAEVDFGQTTEGEGDDRHVGFAFGTETGDDGHFVLGVEGQNMEGIRGCASIRDWCGRNYDTIDNPYFDADAGGSANGMPQNVRRGNIHQAWNSENGIFYIPTFGGRAPNTAATVPLEITASGTGLQDYDTGSWSDGFMPSPLRGLAIGGDGEGIYEDSTLRSNIERETAFAALTYDISERLGFFVDVSAGGVETYSPQDALAADGICMASDYAYLDENPDAAALFDDPANTNCIPGLNNVLFDPATPGTTGILTKKNWDAQTNTAQETSTDLRRVAFGFDGVFGDSTWVWDAYYQYGESDRVQFVHDNRHLDRYNFGFDAVTDPATGEPACRAAVDPASIPPGTAPSLYEGCVPINIFGTGNLTAEAKDWGFGFLRENTTVEQEFVELVASGDVADGFGAGPVRMAAGASYREESIANIAAEELTDAVRRDFLIQYGDSFSGKVDVSEVFSEIDIPFHESFNVNVAGRLSEYQNTAGAGTGVEGQTFTYDISTWKVAGTWDVVDPLRIRFSESHDVRAPNFRELYYRQQIQPGGAFGYCDNPWDGDPSPFGDACEWDLRGGLDLVPEEADTTTLGFVVTPPRTNLRFAVDYFDIDLNDSITPASIDLVLQSCEEGNQAFCDMISGTTQPTFTPGGAEPCPATCYSQIDEIIATAFNYRSYNVSGLDFTADWLKQLPSGTFNLRFLATRTFEQVIQTSTTNPELTEDIAGVTGAAVGFLSDWASAPDLQANVIASWSRGSYTLTGQARYVSDGVNDPDMVAPGDPGFDLSAPVGPNDDETVNVNTVPSYTVYSLSGTYDFDLAGGNQLQLWGSINNLLDEEPPLVGGGVGGTQSIFFDTLGRNARVGMRMNF